MCCFDLVPQLGIILDAETTQPYHAFLASWDLCALKLIPQKHVECPRRSDCDSRAWGYNSDPNRKQPMLPGVRVSQT